MKKIIIPLDEAEKIYQEEHQRELANESEQRSSDSYDDDPDFEEFLVENNIYPQETFDQEQDIQDYYDAIKI